MVWKYVVPAFSCAALGVGLLYSLQPQLSAPTIAADSVSSSVDRRGVVPPAAVPTPAASDKQEDAKESSKPSRQRSVPDSQKHVKGDSAHNIDNSYSQFLERRLQEKKRRLNELLESIFGHVPKNPVSELRLLDARKRATMLMEGEFGLNAAEDIGNLSGQVIDIDIWLGWFEGVTPSTGREGEIAAKIFDWAVGQRVEVLRESPAFTRRALAVIDSYLSACKGSPVSTDTLGSILSALGKLSPSQGALELIRRWTVDTPHGDEAVETSLVEFIGKWPLKEATPLILDVLETKRAGAIKGVVSAWDNTKSDLGAWTVAEAKRILESPLAEAVKTTKKSTGVLYAAIFAAEDLLKPRALEIADALLARRDNAYVSSQGFSFLKVHSSDTANATWAAWLESNIEYKMLAACMSAGNFRDVSSKPNSINKLFELASKSHNKNDLQGAAGTALCQVDSDYSRTLDILHLWLNASQIADPTLVAAGRMVLWGPKSEVRTFLLDEINDANKQPQDRHYAVFLLAILEPSAALDICFDEKNYQGKFTDLTKLLVAATAEGMDRNLYWQSGALLREGCTEPEPDWMKRIRLRQSSNSKKHAEEGIVGYAASRPK